MTNAANGINVVLTLYGCTTRPLATPIRPYSNRVCDYIYGIYALLRPLAFGLGHPPVKHKIPFFNGAYNRRTSFVQ